jgi:3-oxoacid CoA-transferase
MRKIYSNATSALDGVVRDDMSVAVGGFGLCGIPELLIDALQATGCRGLTVISNNAGVDGIGLGKLLETRQIRKMISSYVGENAEFERQILSGELEVELTPQGTLAEKLRAGGAGHPSLLYAYRRRHAGREGQGNARDRRQALRAGAGDLPMTWSGQGLEGRYGWQPDLSPDGAQLQPGWRLGGRKNHNRRGRGARAGSASSIRIRSTRPASSCSAFSNGALRETDRAAHAARVLKGRGAKAWPGQRTRWRTACARELRDGFYVNLGIGIPTLVANYIPAGMNVTLQSVRTACSASGRFRRGEVDPDLINAGKQTITTLPGSCIFLQFADRSP